MSNFTQYGQFGEVSWIVQNLKLPEQGVYVDVGAEDGVEGSNTYYLEKIAGWAGICVEPNPEILPTLRKNRRCKIIECAVGNDPTLQFHLHPTKGWAGFNRVHSTSRIVQVVVKKLDQIIEDEGITEIDLLSLDVEGHELEAWSTFNSEITKPKIVIIEYNTEPNPPRDLEIMAVFAKLPYQLVHRTIGNLIYRFWEQKTYKSVDSLAALKDAWVTKPRSASEKNEQGIMKDIA